MSAASRKLAVLIDGDNVSPDRVGELFEYVARLGTATIRNVYGAQSDKQKWLKAASRFALSQGRRHPQATGRNATDIEMVISAMDIMEIGDVDGLCLASSDSDFTSLAIRARERGKLVFGFGDHRAPVSLRQACDAFHLLDSANGAASSATVKEKIGLDQAIARLREAFNACIKDGWANLSLAAKFLRENYPDFSYQQYGGIKKLVLACGAFELDGVNGNDRFRPKTSMALKVV